MDFRTEEIYSDFTPHGYNIVRSVRDSSGDEFRHVLAPVKTSNVSVPIESIFRAKDGRDVQDYSDEMIVYMYARRIVEMGDRLQYRPITNVKFLSSTYFQYDVEHTFDTEIQNTGPFILNKDERVYVLPSMYIRDKIEPHYFHMYGETYQHEIIMPQSELTLFLRDLYTARQASVEAGNSKFVQTDSRSVTVSQMSSIIPALFDVNTIQKRNELDDFIRILSNMQPMGIVYSRVEYGEGLLFQDDNKRVMPGSKFMIRLASGF